MAIASLPSELLLVVLEYATFERDVFHTGAPLMFAYPPSRSYRESAAALRAGMATKIAISSVCSAWRALAERFLYSGVVLKRFNDLPRLCEVLCQERGAPPSAASCFTPDGMIEEHVFDALKGQTTKGWWTRRLDFAVRNVPFMDDDDLDDEVYGEHVLRLSLLFRACPNMQIIINSTRPPHWFNLVCIRAAVGLNLGAIRVISYEVSVPRTRSRNLYKFFRKARDLRVFDGVVELSHIVEDSEGDVDGDSTGSSGDDSSGDDEPLKRTIASSWLEALRVPLNERRGTCFSRAHFPSLRHITLGAIDFADDTAYLRRFLEHHTAITAVELLESSSRAVWDAVIESRLCLREFVFDHSQTYLLRLVCAVPHTVTHIGVRFRRLQASREDHKAFFRVLELFPNAQIVRFLHPRLVQDLTERHAKFLEKWFAPLALRGVRWEGPDGSLLWHTF